MPERSNSQIQLPMVGKQYLEAAKYLWEGGIRFQTLGKALTADQFTPEQLKAEVKYLAALPDGKRADAIFAFLSPLMGGVVKGREVAGHLLWLAENLEKTKDQLDLLSKSGVDDLRRHVDRPDAPGNN